MPWSNPLLLKNMFRKKPCKALGPGGFYKRTNKELYRKNKTSTLMFPQADRPFGNRSNICRMGA
jgi:hypothetical protein